MIVATLWHSSAIWFADFPSYKPPFCFRISNQPCLIAKEHVCPGQEMAYGLWSSVINRPIVRICKNPIESLQWVYINPYWWMDDHLFLCENNLCFDHGAGRRQPSLWWIHEIHLRSPKHNTKQQAPGQTKESKANQTKQTPYKIISVQFSLCCGELLFTLFKIFKYSICILLGFAYSICMLPSIRKSTGRKETQSSALTQTHWTCCYMLLTTACHFLCIVSLVSEDPDLKPPHDPWPPWPHFDSGQHPPEPSPRAQAKQLQAASIEENLTL